VFAVISIIILMVALNSDWYNFSTDIEYYWEIDDYELSFSFSGVEFKTSGESDKRSWDEVEDLNLASTKQVYETTQKLVIVGIVMNIMLLIGGIVLLFNKLKIIAVLFSILAIIITISALLYFGTMHPQAMDEDSDYPESIGPWDSFKGSNKEGGDFYIQQSWGPVDGFYYVIYGFFFLLVCFGIALVVKVPWIKSKTFSITSYNQYSSSDYYAPQQQQYPPPQQPQY
jgi:hypothetical protein